MEHSRAFTFGFSIALALLPAGTFVMPGRNISVGLRWQK